MEEDINHNGNPELDLKSVPTIEKVLMLQKLLSDLSFRKKTLNDIKGKIISEIDKNCYKYFEGKINNKRTFEFVIDNDIKNNIKYTLCKNNKKFLEDLYEPAYNFYFLLRNDNSLMMQLTELSQKYPNFIEQLSDFFVHFLYTNIIDSSFNEERLILMIYLHLEKQILKVLKDKYLYLEEPFLINVFKSLTRKIDVWNFLGSILNKNILKIAKVRTILSVDIKEVNKNLDLKKNNLYHNLNISISPFKSDEERKKLYDSNIKIKFTKYIPDKEENKYILKRANKIENISKIYYKENEINESESDNEELELVDDKGEIKDMKKSIIIFKKRKKGEIAHKEKNKEKNKFLNIDNDLKLGEKLMSDDSNDKDISFKNLELAKNKSDSSSNEIFGREMVNIDTFFEDNNVTKEKLKEILDGYKKINENSYIYLAMEDYLSDLLKNLDSQIKKENKDFDKNKIEDQEIYSSFFIIEELKSSGINKNKDSFYKLMKNIYINYNFITITINNIIKAISKNIESFPYSIKCILKIIDILLIKKYPNNYSYLKKYIFKANFLIGNLIIPILEDPNFNGIISNIISDKANDNLKIICSVFKKIISGNLFKRDKDKSLVLYNLFIIETLPKIFDLLDNIDDFLQNFKLPNYIINLLKNPTDEKNINYDYFKEKPNEFIQFQSVCFSLQNIYIFINIIGNNRKILIDENKNSKQKDILTEFFNKMGGKKEETKFFDKFKDEKDKADWNYFYIYKILYNDTIEKMLKEASIETLNENKNDKTLFYKNCLLQILSYENYYYLTEFKKINEDHHKNKNKEKNDNIVINNKKGLRSSLINSLISINEEDADFKKIIFPKIEDNLIFEMNSENDNGLIIYCTNYLKLNLDNLPEKYINNNYSLLFNELIIETKNNIEFLSSIVFELYRKINEAEKINILSSNYNSHIKNLEKLDYIKYMYERLLLPYKFETESHSNGLIKSIKYSPTNEKGSIEKMIENFPDFSLYENEYDNILDIEEEAKVPKAIRDYFSAMHTLISQNELFEKMDKKQKNEIIYGLEDLIFNRLYGKLFPSLFSEEDSIVKQKCEELSLLKPEQIIKNKELIKESLLKEASRYFSLINIGISPKEKMDYIIKGLKIIYNLITLTTGKDRSGQSSDDIFDPFLYALIITKIKNLASNVQYINLYLNRDLGDGIYNRISFDLAGACIIISEGFKLEE